MRKLLLVPPFLFTLAVVACGGQADLTAREITDEELRLMVLSAVELGPQYAEFEFDEDESGFRSNEDEIEEDFDPEDEAEDIERFGRVNGYADAYSFPEAISEEQGVFFIATAIGVYEDADGASGDLKDEVVDAQRQIGMSIEDVTLEDTEEFGADGVGDESAGLILTLSASDDQRLTFYGTFVGFRRGRLIGSVVISRLDEEDDRDEVAALARKLDERILAVLRGEASQ